MKESLFGLGETLSELQRIIDASEDGEIDEALAKFLDAVEVKVEEKVEVYCAMIREREARAEALKWERERIDALREVSENIADSMRKRLFEFMQKTNRARIETPTAVVRTQNAGGRLPLELIGDIPVEYKKTLTPPDLDKIREALDSGKELPFAQFGGRRRILVIR